MTTSLLRKVCLVGAHGVGKTSLVRRKVDRCFLEQYHSTIGVRIEKIMIPTPAGDVSCMTWDLRGDDIDRPVEFRYLAGMSAYLLVVDAGQRESFRAASESVCRIEASLGQVPFLLLLNKMDRHTGQADCDRFVAGLPSLPVNVFPTSARTGQGVDEVFDALGQQLMKPAVVDSVA